MDTDGGLPVQDERQRAIQLAYEALDRRERTVWELRMLLERKRVDPTAIEKVVEELRDAGRLDDALYARRFAEDKQELERWGVERIARQLRQRGVEQELIESALAGRDHGTELQAAVDLLCERLTGPPRDERERDRAWKMLVRRGYEPEVAYEAVRALERGATA
jgi:regulatory protein